MPQYLVSTYFPDNFDPATIDEAAGVPASFRREQGPSRPLKTATR
jgi:hypothetical protein